MRWPSEPVLFRMPPVLELTRATVLRGGVRVLHDLSLRIEAGEHTAILGPNGAGKTSLMRVLTLDDRPRAADDGGPPPLRLLGRHSWDLTELRARFAVVTGDLDQRFGLEMSGGRVPGLDVATSGLLGSHGVFFHHDVTPEMRQLGLDALARVDAGHLAAKPLSQMSAGERRRVLIARALVTRPEVLLLDEPTTGLDFVARQQFMDSVGRLAREGTTILIVTHHIEEVIPETRRVVLLANGRIAFDGPPEAALTAERLGAVYGAPLEVGKSGGYYHVRVKP
jgi:iron complex transport system ATP-binding protein